jgi:hypothetical protein
MLLKYSKFHVKNNYQLFVLKSVESLVAVAELTGCPLITPDDDMALFAGAAWRERCTPACK